MANEASTVGTKGKALLNREQFEEIQKWEKYLIKDKAEQINMMSSILYFMTIKINNYYHIIPIHWIFIFYKETQL